MSCNALKFCMPSQQAVPPCHHRMRISGEGLGVASILQSPWDIHHCRQINQSDSHRYQRPDNHGTVGYLVLLVRPLPRHLTIAHPIGSPIRNHLS